MLRTTIFGLVKPNPLDETREKHAESELKTAPVISVFARNERNAVPVVLPRLDADVRPRGLDGAVVGQSVVRHPRIATATSVDRLGMPPARGREPRPELRRDRVVTSQQPLALIGSPPIGHRWSAEGRRSRMSAERQLPALPVSRSLRIAAAGCRAVSARTRSLSERQPKVEPWSTHQ
jgi:hypothetical protein